MPLICSICKKDIHASNIICEDCLDEIKKNVSNLYRLLSNDPDKSKNFIVGWICPTCNTIYDLNTKICPICSEKKKH